MQELALKRLSQRAYTKVQSLANENSLWAQWPNRDDSLVVMHSDRLWARSAPIEHGANLDPHNVWKREGVLRFANEISVRPR